MLRLSRLARARPRVSLNILPSPGHANPHFLDRARLVDPAHPAAKLGLRRLPVFVAPQFTIRAFPNAILHEPTDFVPPNPLLVTALVRAHQSSYTEPRPTSRDNGTRRHLAFIAAKHLADVRAAALAARGIRSISLLFHTSKKGTSKSSVIRRRLRSKMTAAIRLVICRNADALYAPKSCHQRKYPLLHFVSRPLQEGEVRILQDWTYLVIPNLFIYKTPLPNLVPAIRKALLSLHQQATRLEALWSVIPKCRSPHQR